MAPKKKGGDKKDAKKGGGDASGEMTEKELLEQLRSTLHQQKLGLEEISAKVEGIAARVLKT